MLALLLASSLIGLKSMSDINNRMDVMVKNRIEKADLLQTMRNYARERSISLHRIAILKDPFDLDSEMQYFFSQAAYWVQTKERLMAFSLDAETLAILEEILKISGKVVVEQRKIIVLIENGKREEAIGIILEKVIPGQNQILKYYEEALVHQKRISQAEVAQSESAYHDAFISLLLIAALSMSLGIAIASFVIRQNKRVEKKLREDKEEIEYFAYHDTLTGLPNRRLLMDRLQQEVGHSQRLKNCGAVLFVDIDHFKNLNDSLGHNFGDRLIQKVAERIANSRRTDDTVSRLGGDEFVIVLPALVDNIEEAVPRAESIGEHLRSILSKGYMLDAMEYHVTVSIGIAIMQNGLQTPDDLLKQSDSALYAAKDSGRNAVRFYEKSMQEKADKRLSIEQDIRSALFTGQFVLYYQPQISSNGEIVGIEALVRWDHYRKGLILPAEFISVAEESGLIVPMGIEILDTACRFLKSLEQKGLPDSFGSLSVNISPRQFASPDFVDIVREKVAEYDIDASHLMLEITEGMLLHNIDETIEKMELLKELSVCFSIDDFGTGYSSMLYLQRLPLDELKIDQSFIKDVDKNSHNAAIVETIITMARNLNLTLIAEGVEEEPQKKFLMDHGCNSYQGYLFEKPIAEDVLLEKYFSR